MCAWRQNGARTEEASCAAQARAMGLLLEGVAINLPQVDPASYRRFRSGILRSSMRLGEPQSEPDLLSTVAAVVHEFEAYRVDTEHAIDARSKEWRLIAAMLAHLLAQRDRIESSSESWTGITAEIASAASAEELQLLRARLQKLFQITAEEISARRGEVQEEQDRSTANDNAAGLRGGGAAIEHVRTMIAKDRPGYIGLFHLSCLDVVGERFGPEGIQDCLMAVSAFLIQNMRSEDTVYHWSDSSLLAVCDRKIREDILAAELNRVLARNRDFTINIGDRAIMLRIPVDLQLYPISDFESAEDLQNLTASRGRGDRGLAERVHAR